MSLARASYPFLRIASKNIFSDGYTQFPDSLSDPVSCSWLDGQADGPGVEDRGIEDTTREVSRLDPLPVGLEGDVGNGVGLVGWEEDQKGM